MSLSGYNHNSNTFGRSQNNIHNEGTANKGGQAGHPIVEFFGPPRQEITRNPYRNVWWDHFDFKQAYEGKNEYIGRIIDGFIEDQQTWLTSAILPFRYHDGRNITWDKWTFDVPYTSVVPEEGVSRMFSSKKDTQSRSMLRRGIAFQVEHGFWQTPEGIERYKLNIKTIVQAVAETNAFDVLSEVIRAHTHYQVHDDKRSLQERQRARLNYFAIVQKDQNALENLISMCRSELTKRGVKPNAIIMPPHISSYAALSPANKLSFYIKGPDDKVIKRFGPRELDEQGRPRLSPEAEGMLQGINTFITREMNGEDGPPCDLLYRERQIGEYYIMKNNVRSMRDFRTNTRNIMIYDEETDNMEEIKYMDAFENCLRFRSQDGKPFSNLNTSHSAYDDMFTYYNKFNEKDSIEYWGQMHPRYLKSALMDVGDSILGKYLTTKDLNDFSNGLEVIRCMDEERIGATHWVDWINKTKMSDGNGGFKCQEGTPDVPNTRLRLSLPDKSGAESYIVGMRYPAGFNSWEGLTCILKAKSVFGDEGNKWDIAIYRKVDEFVRVINKLASRLKNIFRCEDCLMLNNNSLLGSSEGSIAEALFENLINPDRMPLMTGGVISDDDAKTLAESSFVRVAGKEAASGKKGSKKGKTPASESRRLARTAQSAKKATDISGLAFTMACYDECEKFNGDASALPKVGQIENNVVIAITIGQAATPHTADSHLTSRYFKYASQHIKTTKTHNRTRQPSYDAFDDDDVEYTGTSSEEQYRTKVGMDWEAIVISADCHNMSLNWQYCQSSISDPLIRVVTTAFLFTKCTKSVIRRMANGNVLIPFNFIICRPHATYLMGSLIMMKGGHETGFLAANKPDFQVGDDPHIKMHFGHYTYYSKAIVKEEKNIFMAEDIWCRRYLGRNNTNWFKLNSGENLHNQIFDDDDDDGESFGETQTGKPSLFSILVPYSTERIPNPMHMSGRFEPDEREHYPTSDFYSEQFGSLLNMNRADTNLKLFYDMNGEVRNWTCYRGHQINWRESSTGGIGGFTEVVYGKGHWGKNGTFPGVADIRNGKLGSHFTDNVRTMI